MKERIYLLLGGTGPIGIHLTKALENIPNTNVFVTSRNSHESTEKITYIQGNAKDFDFLRLTIFNLTKKQGRIDVIVDFMVWSNEDFPEVVKLLLPNTYKYVYLSSSRTFADTKGELITEDSPKWLDVSTDAKFLSTDNYAIPKAQQEKLLKNSGFTNYLIIRPYITYAINRLPLGDLEKELWLYRALHGRTIVFSEDIARHYTSLMYGKDVADAICSIVLKDGTNGDSVNITSKEYLKWSDILEIYTSVLKRHIPTLKVKMIVHSLKSEECDYQTLYDRMIDRKFDPTRLNQYVNVSGFTSIREGLTKCLESNIAGFNYNKSLQNWKLQAEFDKTTHEFASAREFSNVKDLIKYLAFRLLSNHTLNFLRGIKRIIKSK